MDAPKPSRSRRIYRRLRLAWTVIYDAVARFIGDDALALASHVAMSTLLALFPFLIFLTAIAGFLNLETEADLIVQLMFETWPETIAEPIGREVSSVLTVPRGDLLTIGILLSIWLASNGIEALRVGLNRAYGVRDTRSFIYCRIQSIGFVILGTLALLVFAIFVIVGPLIWQATLYWAPWLAPFANWVTFGRYGLAILVLTIALLCAHLWLPAGRRSVVELLPGIITTIIAWVAGGLVFAAYLASFADYASTYAGLAGVMSALIFLYLVSAVLLFGGSLNAAVRAVRRKRRQAESAAGRS